MGQESWDRGVGMGEARRFGVGVGGAGCCPLNMSHSRKLARGGVWVW